MTKKQHKEIGTPPKSVGRLFGTRTEKEWEIFERGFEEGYKIARRIYEPVGFFNENFEAVKIRRNN